MPSVRTVYDERVQPYTPSLYMLSAPILGRYRTYPQYTRTPIPGAGFKPAKLVWGEQVLNLDGANGMRRPYPYGNYAAGVPLRGLGQAAQVPPAPFTGGQPTPLPSLDPVRRFVGIAERLWSGPPPSVQYEFLLQSGPSGSSSPPGSTRVTYPGQPPINYSALLDYAKITAVGTFVGIPVAAALGAWAMHRSMRKRVAANRRRAARRRAQ